MTAFVHGQEVVVLDRKGEYEFRGKVMGVHCSSPTQYDVQREGCSGLAGRVPGIPEHQVRAVPPQILAYERRDEQPKHIRDEA